MSPKDRVLNEFTLMGAAAGLLIGMEVGGLGAVIIGIGSGVIIGVLLETVASSPEAARKFPDGLFASFKRSPEEAAVAAQKREEAARRWEEGGRKFNESVEEFFRNLTEFVEHIFRTPATLERERQCREKEAEIATLDRKKAQEEAAAKVARANADAHASKLNPPNPLQQAAERGERAANATLAKQIELEAMDRLFAEKTSRLDQTSANYKLLWNDLQRHKREVMER